VRTGLQLMQAFKTCMGSRSSLRGLGLSCHAKRARDDASVGERHHFQYRPVGSRDARSSNAEPVASSDLSDPKTWLVWVPVTVNVLRILWRAMALL
jgi:hypothetical protein